MTKTEAENLKSFKTDCNCGGYRLLSGRDQTSPAHELVCSVCGMGRLEEGVGVMNLQLTGSVDVYLDNTHIRAFKMPPPPVGVLQITSGFALPVTIKPARFHLWMMRKVFGWTWVDYKKEQS